MNLVLFHSVLWFAFILGSSIFDGVKWGKARRNRGKYISKNSHIIRWIFRAWCALGNSAWYFAQAYPGNREVGWAIAFTALFQGAVFWVMFDVLVNVIAGVKWNHLGTEAFWDRIFNSHIAKLTFQLILLMITLFFTLLSDKSL